MILHTNGSSEIEFKIGIAGTASPPQKVLVVIEQNGTMLSFAADQNDGLWKARIHSLEKLFTEGDASLAINVILNDKIFCPLRQHVIIAPALENTVDISATLVQAPPNTDVPLSMDVATEQVDPVASAVEEPTKTVEPLKMNLIKSVFDRSAPPRKPVSESKTMAPVTKVTPFKIRRVGTVIQ